MNLLHPDLFDQIQSAQKRSTDGVKLFRCIIESINPSWVVAILNKENILDRLLPELADCKGVGQNPYHHLPVFEHTLLVMDFIERICDAPKDYFPESQKILIAAEHQREALVLAAIGHDLGKPDTKAEKSEGYFTFYQHEKESARIFLNMAKRLEVDSKQTQNAGQLISGHMHIVPVAVRYFRNETTERALRKILRKYADLWGALMILGMADSLATRGPLSSLEVARNIRKFAPVLEQFENRLKIEAEYNYLVDGQELMQLTRIPPGRKIGHLLRLERELLDKTPEISKDDLMRMLIEAAKLL